MVLAIAVAGAAAAIVLTRPGNDDRLTANTNAIRTVTAHVSTATTTGNGGAVVGGATAAGTSAEGSLPGVSGQQMQSEIQQMLLAGHEDVVNGNFRGAWGLLSHRKQVQDEREYGYATWVKNQSTLRPYLEPKGLRVSVESVEPTSGVAQVDLTGMQWDKPGAPCSEWSGITWVKYEAGTWKYDPGYSTTPQRESEWKSRYSELLGGRC
jgi:hypothetical protein